MFVLIFLLYQLESTFLLDRFHLRWGCREILYDKSADGETYVSGIAMSKVIYLPWIFCVVLFYVDASGGNLGFFNCR